MRIRVIDIETTGMFTARYWLDERARAPAPG